MPGIKSAEKQFALPAKLLQTIALVESGRPDPVSGRVTPWPWTINVAGVDHFFPTKAAAIEAVTDLQKAGTHSIDVGCMQINLMYHPNAFASLDEAFDPLTNTQYGARFLSALYREIGNWLQASAAYHSRTQEIGVTYETRVMAIWPLAKQFPDDTLRQRGQPAQAEPDTSAYTPEFAARVKEMRADHDRLVADLGAIVRPATQRAKAAEPDYSRYTPEFAAKLKEMRADHARLLALSGPTAPPAGQAAKPVPAPARSDHSRYKRELAANLAGENDARAFDR